MIRLTPFARKDFERLISWIDSEELLVAIAGDVFSFPLTAKQLQPYLEDENSIAFNIVGEGGAQTIGHAEIVSSGEKRCKIDKLIIGDAANRGKGAGQQVIHKLLEYAFTTLDVNQVELNVFDWNIAGIRCYEKCGFKFNPENTSFFQCGEHKWKALNMSIDKNEWVNKKHTGNEKNNPESGGNTRWFH